MNFLVTGGAGFIGSHIVKRLVSDSHNVKVIDNLYSGKKENLGEVMNKIEFYDETILNLEALKQIMKGTDYVIHQAAIASVSESFRRPDYVNSVNTQGTLNVLIAAKENNVKRVVLASSAAVYGETDEIVSEKSELNPISLYGVTKKIDEEYANFYNEHENLDVVCLRYMNVYGPLQNKEYAAVISNFVEKMVKDEKPIIFGDGKQSRDFIFVEDVASANIKACLKENLSSRIFNIGTGFSVNLLELVECINLILGKNIKPEFKERREGDIKTSSSNVSLAKQEFDFTANYSLTEGLKKTILTL